MFSKILEIIRLVRMNELASYVAAAKIAVQVIAELLEQWQPSGVRMATAGFADCSDDDLCNRLEECCQAHATTGTEAKTGGAIITILLPLMVELLARLLKK